MAAFCYLLLPWCEFARVREASQQTKADSQFYRGVLKLGQVCRVRKPVGSGLCSLICWKLELTAGFIGVCWSCKVLAQLLTARGTLYSYPSCIWGLCVWDLSMVKWCLHWSLVTCADNANTHGQGAGCAHSHAWWDKQAWTDPRLRLPLQISCKKLVPEASGLNSPPGRHVVHSLANQGMIPCILHILP